MASLTIRLNSCNDKIIAKDNFTPALQYYQVGCLSNVCLILQLDVEVL
jgi:hypothetical protein